MIRYCDCNKKEIESCRLFKGTNSNIRLCGVRMPATHLTYDCVFINLCINTYKKNQYVIKGEFKIIFLVKIHRNCNNSLSYPFKMRRYLGIS